MRQILQYRLIAVGLMALQILPACASLPKTLPELNSVAKQPAAETVSTEELSKSDTLKACLTTAEELAAQGHAREASQLYEKARAIDPKAVDYSRRLAGLYDLQDNRPKAFEEFTAAIQAFPNDADLHNNFGCYLDRIGNLDEAEKQLRRAMELNPTSNRARVNLGMTLARQGKYDESFNTFSPAVGPAAAHHNLGVILAKSGKTEIACRAFEKALAVNPQFEPSRVFLEVLCSPQPSP